ncbi:hypothetical protein D3C76_1645360 [compost metagenome]
MAIIKDAIKAATVSALKCPYAWSESGGFWEIRSPINTATEATISVRLLKPSASNALEANKYPQISLKADKIR